MAGGDRIVKLGTSINILDPETGEYYVYNEGETVPAEHAELVSHDLAWLSEEDVESMEALLRMARISNASLTEETDPDNAFGPEEAEETDWDEMTVPELRQYAADNNIDLGDATKKSDIVDAISAHQEAGE
jgi:hypothetical protein